jgi:hypothetical protein
MPTVLSMICVGPLHRGIRGVGLVEDMVDGIWR